jgi:hypothetical protein
VRVEESFLKAEKLRGGFKRILSRTANRRSQTLAAVLLGHASD